MVFPYFQAIIGEVVKIQNKSESAKGKKNKQSQYFNVFFAIIFFASLISSLSLLLLLLGTRLRRPAEWTAPIASGPPRVRGASPPPDPGGCARAGSS